MVCGSSCQRSGLPILLWKIRIVVFASMSDCWFLVGACLADTIEEFCRGYKVCTLQMFTGNLVVCEPVNSVINSFSTQIVERLFYRGLESSAITPECHPDQQGFFRLS